MNLSKRVIILDKLNSSTITQAIFILKDENTCEFSAVIEAERIVDDYISGSFMKKRRTFLPLILALLSLSLFLVVFFLIL